MWMPIVGPGSFAERIKKRFARKASIDDQTLHEQMNFVHKALFGWPMDHLTPVDQVLRAGNIWHSTREILRSDRFRWDLRHTVPLWPTNKWVCTEAFGLKIWVDLNDSYVSWGVLHGDWENDEVAFVLSHLGPGDGFVDVGANIGVYTLQAARVVGDTGLVFSIEPRPDTCAMLLRSISDNGYSERCKVFNVALGAEEGSGELNSQHHEINPGSTFVRLSDAGSVRIQALDSLPIPDDCSIKVLKVDIEGFEPYMMDGAKRFFSRHRPAVLAEIFPRAIRHAGRTSEEYYQQWRQLNYRLRRLTGKKVDAEITLNDLKAIENITEPFNIVCLPE